MNNIFWDTNLLLDLLVRPEFSNLANIIIQRGKERGITICISFLSLANFAYILRKNNRDELFGFLRFLCKNFKVLKNDSDNILKAMDIDAIDFEDAIQYETALEGNCECIITRNKKDFYFSQIPVYTPEEFIKL